MCKSIGLEHDKYCGIRTNLDALPDMGSLFPVEIARAVVMIVEHIMCPTFGGNELAMKGWMLSSLNGWSDD